MEDSIADYEATLRALRKNGLENPVTHCADGDEALEFLENGNGTPPPALVMLDLNMPGTDGLEVLKEIRSRPSFKATPVLIMTTSTDQKDVKKCLENGANSYVQKPVGHEGFQDANRRIKEFWFDIAVYPPGERAS